MSTALRNAEKYVCLPDPRIAVPGPKTDVVKTGPSHVSYQTVTTADPTSYSPRFEISPPSIAVGINRRMRLRSVGVLTIVGTGLDTLTKTPSVALRQNALQASMADLWCSVDGSTATLGPISLYVPQLASVANTSASMAGEGSTFPSSPDVVFDYNDAVGFSGSVFESIANASYGDETINGRTAGLTGITLTGTTSLAVAFDFAEELLVSPFAAGPDESPYLFGVQSLAVGYTMSMFHRMLSIALQGTATITGVSAAFTRQELQGYQAPATLRMPTAAPWPATPFSQ